MKRGPVSSLLVSVLLTYVCAASTTYAAPTKEACIAAFDRAQQARRTGQLRSSREELLVCSQEACPAMVRGDCGDVLRQVDAAQPTIVLKAADAKGTDLTAVSVDLNGQKLATSLDGRAIAVDPGKLSLVFTRPPWEPVTVDIVIAEGEKSRIVRATLGPPLPPTSTVTAPQPKAKRTVVGWVVPGVLAAAGAGALGFAGIRRLQLGGEADDLRGTCAPRCPQADRDRMSSDLVTANVMLGVGIGSLVLAAATWFILAPKSSGSGLAVLSSAPAGW